MDDDDYYGSLYGEDVVGHISPSPGSAGSGGMYHYHHGEYPVFFRIPSLVILTIYD